MADDVVILEPGDERAQKISKAMGSQTASDILQILAENKKSLTEITERLAIPLTTAKYHIENLLDAGLISVAETKYSVKGREIKIYSLTNQTPDRCSPHVQCAFAAAEICIIVLYRHSRHAGTIPRIAPHCRYGNRHECRPFIHSAGPGDRCYYNTGSI